MGGGGCWSGRKTRRRRSVAGVAGIAWLRSKSSITAGSSKSSAWIRVLSRLLINLTSTFGLIACRTAGSPSPTPAKRLPLGAIHISRRVALGHRSLYRQGEEQMRIWAVWADQARWRADRGADSTLDASDGLLGRRRHNRAWSLGLINRRRMSTCWLNRRLYVAFDIGQALQPFTSPTTE